MRININLKSIYLALIVSFLLLMPTMVTSTNVGIDTTTIPFVEVISPNGGETLLGWGNYSLVWTMDDPGTPISSLIVYLEWSINGPGGPWTDIAGSLTGFTGNPCVFYWDPVIPLDTACWLSVSVYDDEPFPNKGRDLSDSFFFIRTIDHIVVAPDPLVITVGDTQQFTATAYDVFNVTIPGVDFIWTTDVGSVDANGLFTAQITSGSGTVSATNGTVNGSASVDVVAGPIFMIVVVPNPVQLWYAETQVFIAIGYDVFSNIIPGAVFNWTTDVGTVDATGFFTAQTFPGIGHVWATNGSVNGSAEVTVGPVPGTIDHIVVTPDPVSVVVGSTQQFTATAYDVWANIISGVSFVWTTDAGVVNSTGFFTAQTTPGIGIVTATNGTISGSAIVILEPGPIDHIIVVPDPITIMAGDPMPFFTVIAYDMYNNVIPGVTCNWTSNVWNETGHYILPPGENGWINFTCGNCYYNVTVNIIIGPIDHIIVTPDPAFVIVGMTQQFTATAYDVYNNVISGANFFWSTDVGIINFMGFLTAMSTPGTGTVTATNGSVSGSANVMVVEAVFNIDLIVGWNLISLPLEQYDEAIDQVLISIDGKWDCIRAYDAMNDKWLSNMTSRPDSLNDLKTLDHKMGFWINIIEPGVTLTVGGSVPASTSINLHAGWNLVGYPSLTNETVANALWGTGTDKVMVFDPAESYGIKEVGPSYVMKPGEGYWVHVPVDAVWMVDW